MNRRTLLLLLFPLASGATLATAVTSRAAGLPCGILTPCGTTTTAPPPTATAPTPTTTATTPTPTATPPAQLAARGRDDGEIGRLGRVTVIASANGRQVTALASSFAGDGHCNDGQAFSDHNVIELTGKASKTYGRPLTITSAGDVAYHRTFKGGEYRHGVPVIGAETYSMTAHFSGAEVTGTIRDQFSGHGFRCDSGTIQYAAYRDGTPQAPRKNADVETGRYAATGAFFDVFLPGQVISVGRFPVPFHCTFGQGRTTTFTVASQPFTGTGFSRSSSGPVTDSHKHVIGHQTYQASGTFSRRGSLYLLSMHFRNVQHFTLAGRHETCTGSYSATAYGP